MENVDFLGIAIVGSAVSLLMNYLKARFGAESLTNKLVVIALSIVFGAIYYFLRDTVLWQTILGILVASSSVYALLLKK